MKDLDDVELERLEKRLRAAAKSNAGFKVSRPAAEDMLALVVEVRRRRAAEGPGVHVVQPLARGESRTWWWSDEGEMVELVTRVHIPMEG